MYILGGWLGSGPHANNEMYVLDLDTLVWSIPFTKGSPPGPCNMHSADPVGSTLFVFRGGDGQRYLNDLHSLDISNNGE